MEEANAHGTGYSRSSYIERTSLSVTIASAAPPPRSTLSKKYTSYNFSRLLAILSAFGGTNFEKKTFGKFYRRSFFMYTVHHSGGRS